MLALALHGKPAPADLRHALPRGSLHPQRLFVPDLYLPFPRLGRPYKRSRPARQLAFHLSSRTSAVSEQCYFTTPSRQSAPMGTSRPWLPLVLPCSSPPPLSDFLLPCAPETIARVVFPPPTWITATDYTALRSDSDNDSAGCGFFSLNMSI